MFAKSKVFHEISWSFMQERSCWIWFSVKEPHCKAKNGIFFLFSIADPSNLYMLIILFTAGIKSFFSDEWQSANNLMG